MSGFGNMREKAKYLNELSPVDQTKYLRPVKRPTSMGQYLLRNLKSWCADHGYVMTIVAGRETLLQNVWVEETYTIERIPSEWDDLIVKVTKVPRGSKQMVITIDGHIVPGSMRDLAIEEYRKLAKVASDAVDMQLWEVQASLNEMEKQREILQARIADIDANYNAYDPDQVERMLNGLDCVGLYRGLQYESSKLAKNNMSPNEMVRSIQKLGGMFRIRGISRNI